MNLGKTALVILLALAAGTAWAQETTPAATVALQYAPAKGESETSIVVGTLDDIAMNGMSLGINGRVQGVSKLTVIATDAEKGNSTVRNAFEVQEAQFAGQPREPRPIQPADVTLNRRGDIVKIVRAAQAEAAGLEALTGGGLPLDAVALMATNVWFPEAPVAVGASWTRDQEQELPVVGKAKVTTVTRVVKVEGCKVTLESESHADVPPFEVDNPLLQGKMKVESAKFDTGKVQRQYDTARSVVTTAKGTFKLDLTADMGFGVPTPISATGSFDLRPKPKPEEAAQPAAGATETAPAPAEPAAAPTDDKEAARRGVQLGPLAASGSCSAGVVDVALQASGSGMPLPGALARYRAPVDAATASCSVAVGFAGPQAGSVSVAGRVQVGPMAVQRSASVNLRDLAQALIGSIVSFIRQRPAAG